jgi:TatD DNase family protein
MRGFRAMLVTIYHSIHSICILASLTPLTTSFSCIIKTVNEKNAQTSDKKITLIDTHCHLEMDEFNNDRDAVIQRARDAGVEALITIGSDLTGNAGGYALSEKFDFIYSAVGFHPHDAKYFTEEIFKQIKEWSRGGKVVAIGEIGLDYHYDHSPREIQQGVFRKQLSYAKQVDLPVVIHSREAEKDTLDILRQSGVKKGVFHCFSGGREMAIQVLEMGFHISIAGPVTFKKATGLHEIARIVPDISLLIETDAPYLTPEPFRGKRNEPSYLVHTATAIAALRGVTLEDIARITTLNAKRLFGIGALPDQGEITYKIRDSLYLNVTNRCTNQCSFCIRFHSDYVKGHHLRLSHEPSEQELKDAIGDSSRFKEIVFCGYGEPLLRFDLVKRLSAWIKQQRGRVRINTNGHGNFINKRNILPELSGIVDNISISLDAQDEETYNSICKPAFQNAYSEVLSFIREAKKVIPDVQVTVVALETVDVGKCRKIAEELGVGFRVREYDTVG